MIRVNFYCCLDNLFRKTDNYVLKSIVEVEEHGDVDKVVADKFAQHSAEGWKVTIDAPDDLRRISELIQEIIGLGMQWVPTSKKARTAVNTFVDPIGNRRYITHTSGKVQAQGLRTDCMNWMSVVNPIRREPMKGHSGTTYHRCHIVKLYTEAARLQRLLDCLKIVKAKQVAAYLRKIESMKKSRQKISGYGIFRYL